MVIALSAMIIALAVKSIGLMTASSDISSVNGDITRIQYGLNQYVVVYKVLPSGSAWPVQLNGYVDASLINRYQYACQSGGAVKITTARTFSDSSALQKFIDQRLCGTSSTWNSDKTITCVLYAFANQACQ